MAYVDPYTGQILGYGMMSPYAGQQQAYPSQLDIVAAGIPGQYGSMDGATLGFQQGMMSTGGSISPEAQQRAIGAIGQRAGSLALGAGKRAIGAGLSGANLEQAIQSGIQGIATPSGLVGLAVDPVHAAYGLTPETALGKAVSFGTKTIGGLLGGPFGAVLGTIGGSPIGSAIEDAFGLRSMEQDRDVVEDVRGQIKGRMDIADALTGAQDTLGTVDEASDFRDAANKAIDKLGLGISRSTQKAALGDIGAYQRAQDVVDAAYAEKAAQERASWGGKAAPGRDASGESRGFGSESEAMGSRGGFGGTGIGGR